MSNRDHKKAQAALELAIFGAILIFLLGTIVRTAAGNSYTQDQNFKAMRMALLSSWQGSENQNMSRNSASILIVEDRLSPDFNKYGALDRNPYIANGGGSFTYELLYPLAPTEVSSNLPIMDVYINGEHFPFTLAQYFSNKQIQGPGANCSNLSGCQLNQCERNNREWVGGVVRESQLELILPITPITATSCLNTGAYPTTLLQNQCQEKSNADEIFKLLQDAGIISTQNPPGQMSGTPPELTSEDTTISGMSAAQFSTTWTTNFVAPFKSWYESQFPSNSSAENTAISTILAYVQRNENPWKLLYTLVANPMGSGDTVSPAFSTIPPSPSCTSPPCKDQALTADMPLFDFNDNPTTDGVSSTNTNAVMQYDLLRMGNYTQVLQNFPLPTAPGACTACFRDYVAWQWAATAGTSAAMIGLNTTNNQYPNYDVDGRLKEVTIFGIVWNPPTLLVSYEDMQAGDIDDTWDSNSCGPKPGLQNDSQIFTFTQDGTYLQINEGKLYNAQTGQVVRSANKRDSVDLIQRMIQLSNNTGRFCNKECSDGSTCQSSGKCSNGSQCVPPSVCDGTHGVTCASPNPVTVCVDSSNTTAPNCNTESPNFKLTCYDESDNMLFVRSRLQDLRGRFWLTNASGQLQVK